MTTKLIPRLLWAGIAVAASVVAAGEPTNYSLRIEAQPLEKALQEFARQSGIQVVFFSAITDGVSAPAVEGSYTLDDAMDRLLGSSGLSMRMINAQTLEIRRAPASAQLRKVASVDRARPEPMPRSIVAGSNRMEEVVVIGAAEQLVATRVPTPLLEIPQTVSIISREQLRQQNSTDLADALRNAAGISVLRSSSLDQLFYSRGLEIRSFHLDGGAALVPRINTASLFMYTPDLSEYEHIEVLRGADALFTGNGNPGGTVSMVRKRPLLNPQATVSLTSGSWDTHRAELDVTGPIALDGALRGRVDMVYSNQDYFYDYADLRRKRIFAVAEFDAAADATLTAGGSYQRDDATPFLEGLPLRSDGQDPHLPRDTSLIFDWAFQETQIAEGYVQWRQRFGDDWALKVNTSYWRTKVEAGVGAFNSRNLIDPVTNGLNIAPDATFTGTPNVHWQLTSDVTFTGTLDWFGKREEFAIGGDFMRFRAHVDSQTYMSVGAPLVDVSAFDPRDYRDPRQFASVPDLGFFGVSTLDQYGIFGSLRTYFDDAWSAIVGLRLSSDNVDTDLTLAAPGISFPTSAGFGSRRVLTPYAALMYTFGGHYSVYASYADVYLSGGSLRRMDGTLIGPTHGLNVELGLKGEWRGGALNGTLVAYSIAQRNYPIVDLGRRPPGLNVINCCYVTGIGRSKGADLELNGEIVPGWLIGGGYTYNYSEDANESRLTLQTPRHLLKLWTSKRLNGALDRWTLSGSVHAQSSTRNGDDLRCIPGTCAPLQFTQPGYATVDLRVGFDVNSNWRVALSANNVLDERYYETIGRPSMHVWYGEPRNYMLRVDGEY